MLSISQHISNDYVFFLSSKSLSQKGSLKMAMPVCLLN